MEYRNILLVIAQDDTPAGVLSGGGAGDGTGTQQSGDPNAVSGNTGQSSGGGGGGTSSWMLFLPLILVMVFIFWSSSSAQKKEKRKRNEMLASIGKHDKVQTIGGVIGSVVEIKDTEVILKVDEANNIKMHFARSAIQQVVSEVGTSAS